MNCAFKIDFNYHQCCLCLFADHFMHLKQIFPYGHKTIFESILVIFVKKHTVFILKESFILAFGKYEFFILHLLLIFRNQEKPLHSINNFLLGAQTGQFPRNWKSLNKFSKGYDNIKKMRFIPQLSFKNSTSLFHLCYLLFHLLIGGL